MRQEATRAHKGWALDRVTIHNKVLKQNKDEITAPPSVRMTFKNVSVLISVFKLHCASFGHIGLLEEKVTTVFTLLLLLSIEHK